LVFLAGQYQRQGKSGNIVKNNKTYPFICKLFKDGLADNKTALLALQQLAEYISECEFNTIRLLMEKTE
jgi:predicted NAD/FAD-binding protein